ncbi:Uncharacterised protein [Vibrio cholerae]|nr:Uncharacterised protein [Vibrio cholerae]
MDGYQRAGHGHPTDSDHRIRVLSLPIRTERSTC